MRRLLILILLISACGTLYGQRKGNIVQRKESFIDIREQLGLYAALVKKNCVPAPALWQRTVEARECDELLILPDGNILLGTVDMRAKAKSFVGGILTGHGIYALFPNYSTLYKVDAGTGEILWKYERTGEMGTAVHDFVDISDASLVIHAGDGKKEYLLQLDLASGKELWRQEIEPESQCMTAADNIIVFRLSSKGVLSYTGYALADRKRICDNSPGKVSRDYRLTGFGQGKIAVTDSTACYMIDAVSGGVIEKAEAASPYTNVYATPASVLLVSANGDCVMFDGEGRKLWNRQAGLPPLLCDEWDDNIYWITDSGGVSSLSAVEKGNGRQRWSCPLDGSVMSGFTIHDGILALTTVSSLWFIDTETGKPVRQMGVPAAKERSLDLIQRRGDNWIVTYETAIECYDSSFEKQWGYEISRFVKTASIGGVSGGGISTGNNLISGMANFHMSMFSLQQSINNNYANYLKYGKFNPGIGDSPTSIAGFKQGVKAEKQAANFALAGQLATMGASVYFDIIVRKIKAEYAEADRLRAACSYRLASRETESSSQEGYYIRRFETTRSRNLLIVDLKDGKWAEIVLGPREGSDVEENALLNTCRYVYHPDKDIIVANGIGLDPSKWETMEINKTSTVKSSLLSFRIADMNFREYADYPANTIAK